MDCISFWYRKLDENTGEYWTPTFLVLFFSSMTVLPLDTVIRGESLALPRSSYVKNGKGGVYHSTSPGASAAPSSADLTPSLNGLHSQCVALLDVAAIAACMVDVDLNPIPSADWLCPIPSDFEHRGILEIPEVSPCLSTCSYLIVTGLNTAVFRSSEMIAR